MPEPSRPSAAVVVATYNRPDHVRRCLDHLAAQTVTPDAVIVVDSSPGTQTRDVVAERAGVTYLRNERGAGHTATSRMIGVAAAGDVDVVAFVDDDAYAEHDWLELLLRRYDDPTVGAVGGRATNGQPGEEREGLGAIGRFLPNGTLTGHFAADPGRDVEVDHLLGANMSVRRAAVEEVGGLADHYPGTCLREETEIALRLRLAGYRILYVPEAVVEHVAGPYAKGRRFDLRYTFYGERNHLVLLGRTVGVGDVRFRRYLGVGARTALGHVRYAAVAAARRPRVFGDDSKTRGIANGLSRAGVCAAGGLAGAAALVRLGVAGELGGAR